MDPRDRSDLIRALAPPPPPEARAALLEAYDAAPKSLALRLLTRPVPAWQAAAAALLLAAAAAWLASPRAAGSRLQAQDVLYDAAELVALDPSHL